MTYQLASIKYIEASESLELTFTDGFSAMLPITEVGMCLPVDWHTVRVGPDGGMVVNRIPGDLPIPADQMRWHVDARYNKEVSDRVDAMAGEICSSMDKKRDEALEAATRHLDRYRPEEPIDWWFVGSAGWICRFVGRSDKRERFMAILDQKWVLEVAVQLDRVEVLE